MKKKSETQGKPATPKASKQVMSVAIIGAGMAGIVCARTLAQAGHSTTVFEKSRGAGGRMSTRPSPFGGFDHGAQYFTVRDGRFAQALQTAAHLVRPWSANTVRVLDEMGHVLSTNPPAAEPHFVPSPGMNSLVRFWAEPLQHPEEFGLPEGNVLFEQRVTTIERDAINPDQWQLRTTDPEGGQRVIGGFDRVVLAVPHPQAHELLQSSGLAPELRQRLTDVGVAPCWTLMVAYPQAMQPNLYELGPQWNVARSTHHRIAWVSRENSKPGRELIERWTIQASPEWSAKHLEDGEERVKAKLLKGFAEITGIRATPAHAEVHRWRYAQTTEPLNESYLLDKKQGIGLCGDWCLGHRVENAFVSGLEMALALI